MRINQGDWEFDLLSIRMQRKPAPEPSRQCSFCPPMKEIFAPIYLLLQLKKSVKKCLGCGWTTRNINVYRDNPITTPNNWIGVMVISTTICTASHRYHPPRLGHLIIHSARRIQYDKKIRGFGQRIHSSQCARNCNKNSPDARVAVSVAKRALILSW